MVKQLKLENFRNHKKYQLDLSDTTVLIGKNGKGKTNVLEAITLISFGRSFREDDRKRLIEIESDYARVNLDENEIFMQKKPRLLTQTRHKGINKKMSEMVGQIPCVVFSPETLDIITGQPSERRRFLDIAISQVDRIYLKNLNAYTKIRRQRNKLLERIAEGMAGEDELSYWDQQLSQLGDSISKKRRQAITQVNENISENYKVISGQKNCMISIQYQAKSGESLMQKLLDHRHAEIALRNTIFGPHRDDILIEINGMDTAHYASRGETRSAILALKVAELNYLQNERKNYPEIYDLNVYPLLLLDDVYSEFDAERREHLAELISKYQSLITTTDIEHLSKKFIKDAKIIELK